MVQRPNCCFLLGAYCLHFIKIAQNKSLSRLYFFHFQFQKITLRCEKNFPLEILPTLKNSLNFLVFFLLVVVGHGLAGNFLFSSHKHFFNKILQMQYAYSPSFIQYLLKTPQKNDQWQFLIDWFANLKKLRCETG